jgi:hypothetical protein
MIKIYLNYRVTELCFGNENKQIITQSVPHIFCWVLPLTYNYLDEIKYDVIGDVTMRLAGYMIMSMFVRSGVLFTAVRYHYLIINHTNHTLFTITVVPLFYHKIIHMVLPLF